MIANWKPNNTAWSNGNKLFNFFRMYQRVCQCYGSSLRKSDKTDGFEFKMCQDCNAELTNKKSNISKKITITKMIVV